MKGYIGTYTDTTSKGIYTIEFDENTGKIALAEEIFEMDNPTYLYHDSNKKILYAISETVDRCGQVVEIPLDTPEKNYTKIKVDGQRFCHLNVDSNRNILVAASYHGGFSSVFKLNDGHIEKHLYDIDFNTQGKISRCHFAGITNDIWFITDLGADLVAAFTYDKENEMLKRCSDLTYHSKKGSGPRHIAFNQDGNAVYVVNELSSTIDVLIIENNKIHCIQTISTLPIDVENSCAAIKITKDNKYLYASNRGHDSIAIFSILKSGKLDYITCVSTEGIHPRDFEIDPTGKFLLAANISTNNIVVFEIDKFTGKIKNTGNMVSIPKPVCIKFVQDDIS